MILGSIKKDLEERTEDYRLNKAEFRPIFVAGKDDIMVQLFSYDLWMSIERHEDTRIREQEIYIAKHARGKYLKQTKT
jgi:hypothetical protein